MRMKNLYALTLLLGLAISLSGCNENEGRSSEVQSMRGNAFMAADAVPIADLNAPQAETAQSQRRIAETHSLTLHVKRETLRENVLHAVTTCRTLNCEIINSSVSTGQNDDDYARSRSRTPQPGSGMVQVRIAPADVAPFLAAVTGKAEDVASHSISADDKTLQYLDTEARLNTKKALHERLMRMLETRPSADIKDILELEREITKVQGEIESATAQLRHLATITERTTVNLSYRVPQHFAGLDTSGLGRAWHRAQRELLDSTENVIVFIGGSLPWIPVLLFGLWLFVRTIRFAFGRVRLLFWRKPKN